MFTWQSVFLHHDRVRPIWRCLLSLILIGMVYLTAATLLSLVFHLLPVRRDFFLSLLGINLLALPGLLLAYWLLTKVFDGKPFGSVGLALHERWKQELVIGLLLGILTLLVVVTAEVALGLARLSWGPSSFIHHSIAGLYLASVLLLGATNEELVFRGYPFQRLIESIGPWAATVLASAAFAAAHLGNPRHTWLSALNTGLAGLLLAVAYLRTRSLWLPIGFHFSWNFFQGYVLGLPVSGLPLPTTLIKVETTGAQWITGGDYGPEGGALATVVLLVGTLYLLLSPRIYVSRTMKDLVFGQDFASSEDPGAVRLGEP